ncbi:mucin-5AC [Anopheles ziemanni]|uniref:mucin-5AC n=1 Tax=Anopheles coustani TaxID=139045 RepID=UPI002657C22B|nr:mucin-5AC [Anopheles coustani]XP_058169631.1 mucin-5AC [Anopheles ziemanni]
MPEVGTMGGSMEMRKSATVVACLAMLLLQLGTLLPRSAAQQNNNFYFAQSQGRFVPSFESPRNGFFPSALQRQQPPPDSYQEQTLFVNNNNVDRGTGASEGTGSRGITPSYYQFTYTTPRSADIFEISPRPFSATPSSNSGFQYSRSPLRSDFFSNGLTPSRTFPATGRQPAGSQRKSPFGSFSADPSTTEAPQRPPPPAAAPPAPASDGPSVRDRQLSYISNRARPFASEDRGEQSGTPTRATARQQLPRSPAATAVVTGGTRNSYSSSRSRQPDSTQATLSGQRQTASRDVGTAQNGSRLGGTGTQGSSGSSSNSRTTLRPNRYRSTPTTTTTEAATERTTAAIDTAAVRNRFSGRTPAPNAFRQTFEAKRVSATNSAIAPRGSFVNSNPKAKATTTTSTPTTTTSTTTTTGKLPVLSRFIHQPAKPIIPSINITHNGSAKSAEVIYDYEDYESESKESTGFGGEKQEINDFQPTSVAKNNSIALGSGDATDEQKTLPGASTTVATNGGTQNELEDPDGRLNNISENEYYDTVRESGTAPGDSVGVEDHTVILTDNFYLPGGAGGSEETFEDEGEEGEEGGEEPASLQREINSTAELGATDPQEKAYDEEYVYEDEEPGVTTTVRTPVKTVPVPPPVTQDDSADMLQFSDEDAKDVVEEARVLEATKETLADGSPAPPTSSVSTESSTESSASPSTTTERVASSSEFDGATNATTESWVVVASVQTSRSVSGARFLPFPQVNQDEKKQPLADLEIKGSNESDDVEATTASGMINDEQEGVTTVAPQEPVIAVTQDVADSVTTEKTILAQSTESIIDKLDRVQSELSSGLFAGKFPVLKDPTVVEDQKVPGSTALPPVVIRKFQPNARATTTKKPRPGLTTTTTTAKPTTSTEGLVKKIKFETVDDISALLPPDYKAKAGFKLKKPNVTVEPATTTTTTTTRETPAEEPARSELVNRFRSANISRSYKSNVPIQELSSLLPKDYKLNRTEEDIKSTNNLKELISKVKVNGGPDKPNVTLDVLKKVQKVDVSAFLPPGYKPPEATSTTSRAPVSIEDDVSKFLPPGYKTFKTTKKPNTSPVTIKDDISKLLPPGYKLPKENTETVSEKPKLVFSDDLSKFLPPGYKPPAEKPDAKPVAEVIDPSELLKKIQFKDVSALLPPGFNASKAEEPVAATSTAAPNRGVIFASRPGVKKPPAPGAAGRSTTAKPAHAAEGPKVPEIHIRKGPPTRATTEFTGWPTPSTTPISIEKLLEQQKQQELLEKLLAASSSSTSTTTSTTTTTTTTTTTPRPTEPGLCHSECDLAGTIRIVDGVTWVPELLDHNTAEWKKLARDVETELNEVYSKAKNLSKWYKKVRIDSFNKGSVLVDYFVELSDLSRDVNTLEIRKMFHEALVPVPEPTTTTTTTDASVDDYDGDDGEGAAAREKVQRENLQAPVPRVKEVFQLGKFKVDPVYTDFSVIPKPIIVTGPGMEDDLFLPQWAIAGIVIGLASLLFVILFGVTVLINRQKAAKKKAPTPLTADMLNELNKNHMGGIENFGSEELYNMDDAWDDRMHDVKPKRFSNSMHGSSASNIYDSWRSQRHPENYFYDEYGLKGSHYPPSGHHRLHDPAFMMHEPPPPPVMAMYPPYHHAPAPPNSHHFSNSSRRYYRDYDPNF